MAAKEPAMWSENATTLVICGLVFAGFGLILIHRRVSGGGATLRLPFIEMGLSTSGLAVFVVGAAMIATPFVLPHFREPITVEGINCRHALDQVPALERTLVARNEGLGLAIKDKEGQIAVILARYPTDANPNNDLRVWTNNQNEAKVERAKLDAMVAERTNSANLITAAIVGIKDACHLPVMKS